MLVLAGGLHFSPTPRLSLVYYCLSLSLYYSFPHAHMDVVGETKMQISAQLVSLLTNEQTE